MGRKKKKRKKGNRKKKTSLSDAKQSSRNSQHTHILKTKIDPKHEKQTNEPAKNKMNPNIHLIKRRERERGGERHEDSGQKTAHGGAHATD